MAIGISLTDIASLQNETTALTALNDNFDAIAAALPDGLSRSGNTPNTMSSPLDMNSNQILNLPAPIGTNSPLRVADATTLNGGGIVTISPLPTGGTTGQVLAKTDNGNYDVGWASPQVVSTSGSNSLTLTGSTIGTVALTGDVTTAANNFNTTITSNAVSGSKFRQSAGLSVVGNPTNGTANVLDLSGSANQMLSVNSAGNALGFVSVSGDISNSNGTLTIGSGAVNGSKISSNTVQNSNLTQMNAATLKGNPSASSANAVDFTVQGLVNNSSPDANNDKVVIFNHTTGTLEYSTPGQISAAGTAGVSAIDTLTGAFTTGNGVTSTGSELQLTAARRTLPTSQVFTTAGSGTYTTPTNALWIEIHMIAGGGGGAGNGSSGAGNGDVGVASSFNSITAAPGNAGTATNNTVAGNGGTTGGSGTGSAIIRSIGGAGSSGVNAGTVVTVGPLGANSFYGGGGAQTSGSGSGGSAQLNTGSGGGGAQPTSTLGSGGSGAAGEYVYFIINSPTTSYSYIVGAAGTGGTAGSGGNNGGNGAAGRITVIEHYGS